MTKTPSGFASLGLPSRLNDALADIGYETPSPIQAACIPELLAGHDLLGEAQTGTGKTAAFALPALAALDSSRAEPQVLVLTPTRELAIQVAEAFTSYARHYPDFHILPLYGGQSMVVQLRQLKRGAQVIVGTPGRVMDHLKRQSLRLDALRLLVLDEADEMLRMGFIDDVEWILTHTPAERQTALFSATMPPAIRVVAHRHLRDPREVKIAAQTATVTAIRQRYWQVRGVSKLDGLTRILEAEESLDAAIVFVRTKNSTVSLAESLTARGYAAAALNGDLTQGLREQVVDRLKRGLLDIVIATDVAARGIDVPRITHVFNYDVPYDTEAYVHRIGRTGRAGRTGDAILFVAPRELRMLRAIERATGQSVQPMSLPSQDMVTERRIVELQQRLNDALEADAHPMLTELADRFARDGQIDHRTLSGALLCLLHDDRALLSESDEDSGWAVATAPVKGRSDRPERARRDERGDRFGGPDRFERGDRFDRGDRPERGDRPDRTDRPHRARAGNDGALVPYRIRVGRSHGVTPREIVGALANEGGIQTTQIGQIHLFADFSSVELPSQLPPGVLARLGRIRVCGHPIELAPADASELPPKVRRDSRMAPPRKAPDHKKPHRGRPGGDKRKPPRF